MDLGSLGRFEADLSRPLLFKRCATCPATPPPCPACGPNEICSLIGGGCDSCAVTLCTPIGGAAAASSNNGQSGKSSSPAGPIAGGVIGGIVVICILTFFFWRFCIKKRRQQYEAQEEAWRASTFGIGEKTTDGEFGQHRDARASVHSVRSIASTVLTRASNVIQIAYIPGITNRSVDPSASTPEYIPPVPPIPAMSPLASPSHFRHQDNGDHYFMPSDLRDSTFPPRDSYNSMSPSVARGSYPSTAYRDSAVVNATPAQTAIRGKANPVAVRTNGHNSPADQSPSDEKGAGRIASPMVARIGVSKAVTVTRSNNASKDSSPVDSKKPSLSSQDESPIDRQRSSRKTLEPNSPISELPASPSQYRLQPIAMTVANTHRTPETVSDSPFSDAHMAGTP